jgi:hypothetical protein
MCCNIWAATPIAWPSLTIAWSPSPMAKLPFAGVIPLTTTNRSRYPYSVDEFLSRFLLHLLPEGFVRIRNFGFLANRKRATLLPF